MKKTTYQIPEIRDENDNIIQERTFGKKSAFVDSTNNEHANIRCNDGKKNYFINSDGDVVQSAYQRLFIRQRKKRKP